MRKIINFLIDGIFFIPAAILLALFAAFAYVPALDGVYEEFMEQRNPAVLAIIMIALIFLLGFSSWLMGKWYTLKLISNLKIEDINERINAQEDLLKTYFLDQGDKEMAGTFVKSKMTILYTLAISYISHFEDYKTALTYLERAALLSVRLKMDNSNIKLANNLADNCRLWEALALSALGEYDSAERKIAPSMAHIKTLAPLDRATVWLAQTDLATRRKDIAAAREYHGILDTELREIAAKFKQPDVIYDSILFDGILDKLEGKTDLARTKLEDVLNNTPDGGNRLRARRELEELIV